MRDYPIDYSLRPSGIQYPRRSFHYTKYVRNGKDSMKSFQILEFQFLFSIAGVDVTFCACIHCFDGAPEVEMVCGSYSL
jgi:hypothetical protein